MAVGISFKEGKCLEAIEYYCDIFGIDFPKKIIRYSDFECYNFPKDVRNRIYNSKLEIYGNNVYLFDTTDDKHWVNGNNGRVVIETNSENLYKAFQKLKEESIILMEPQKINKKLFTTLIDKYNVHWQIIADT
ncbi:hypothetical protein HV819_05005 [Anaerococcus sp. AGMB00486]|uniref:VOC family protein n=2 Tax=Anaerococcus TaxID=165779 RepID=A0ABX2N9G3_9FIRM|nr:MULTISPECIES: hypothetical protein [Anaerococcus]MSS78491.1 hypothetical protein [Anaerococcus porci]NVF11347.1 hypothetical protein [Anaerococcus faecalis]